MPLYQTSAFYNNPQPPLLVPGSTGYSFGKLSGVGDTNMKVTNVAITSNVATITVVISAGPVPIAGQFISTQALANIPNVTSVVIASVSSFADQTNGTITYALSHANVSSVADVGQAIAPPVEVGDTVTPTVAVTGAAFSLASLQASNERSVAWSVSFPATPPSSSFEADLEGAVENVDAQFTKLDKITAVTGASQTVNVISQLNFLRVRIVSNDAATSIVAKMAI